VSCSLLPGVWDRTFGGLWAVRNSLLFRHYLFLIWIVASLLFFARGRLPVLVSSLIGISYFAGFVWVDAAPDWRYLLPCYVCAWIGLLSYLFQARQHRLAVSEP